MKRISPLLIFLLSIISIPIFAQKIVLTPTSNIEKKLLKNETHQYAIALLKGEYVSCVVMQKGVDLAVGIVSPAGKKLQIVDSPNGSDGPEPVSILATETGVYELRIFAMNDQSTTTDSASKAAFAEQNQGMYTITNVIKLSPNDYQKKLDKEAADKILFTKWLTTNSHSFNTVDAGHGSQDLQPFKQILKDVNVVGLGEASHGTSEFFKMKHRMLEFLVNEMGFTSFYIEASMTRCRYVNDYVLYGKGTLDSATVIQGFTTWRVEEVRNMIGWIRQHNKIVSEDKKVKFMGYDLQINDYGWKDLKQFYSVVNPSMNALIDTTIKQTTKAAMLSNGPVAQQQEGAAIFKAAYRSCFALLGDLILKGGQYKYAVGTKIYEQNLMDLKLIIQEIESFKDGYNDKRDYYMAQNIMWLLSNEKKNAKVVIWAHNGHIRKSNSPGFNSMGSYLNSYLQSKYYSLGFEFYSGSFQTRNFDLNNSSRNWDIVTVGTPPIESLPWYLDKTGKTRLFIDFRHTEAKNMTTFNQSINMHSIGSGFSPKFGNSLYAEQLESFDGIIYIKQSNAAKNFTKINLN